MFGCIIEVITNRDREVEWNEEKDLESVEHELGRGI